MASEMLSKGKEAVVDALSSATEAVSLESPTGCVLCHSSSSLTWPVKSLASRSLTSSLTDD